MYVCVGVFMHGGERRGNRKEVIGFTLTSFFPLSFVA